MTTNSKYHNENVIHTIKVLESLEGTNFEPVHITRIMERANLKRDKTMRVLLTLEALGWAQKNEKDEWSVGAKVLRFSNRYSEICIATIK